MKHLTLFIVASVLLTGCMYQYGITNFKKPRRYYDNVERVHKTGWLFTNGKFKRR
jgi:hypothetical protein